MRAVLFEGEAFKEYIEWATLDKKTFGRINELIKDIDRNLFDGKGKSEPLKHDYQGYWSRRITDEPAHLQNSRREYLHCEVPWPLRLNVYELQQQNNPIPNLAGFSVVAPSKSYPAWTVSTCRLHPPASFLPSSSITSTKKTACARFYNRFPTLSAFQDQINERTFDPQKRQILVDALQRQYQHIATKPDVSHLLQANTFTVTTGHQLNIFTGPLYIVYKLITTIKLARQLKAAYPAYNFVPVYWMATEDHDFAEINHFSLFGKKYSWQTEQRGAIGRMNPQELKTLFAQIPEKLALFEDAYLKQDTLAAAVRYYVNELFGAEGLICLDADDAALKRVFAPVMRDELIHHQSGPVVQKQTERLANLGYKDGDCAPRHQPVLPRRPASRTD